MHINRNTTTLFPPAGGQADPNAVDLPGAPATRPAEPLPPGPVSAVAAPGVVLKLSSAQGANAEPAVYTKSQVLRNQKIDLSNMTLENQLVLGKNQGVFTKITLSKDGILLAKPGVAADGKSPEFVTSAVTAMRDFQEGIALLKEQAPDAGSKGHGFFSGGLRSLQHAAAKLNVFA